MLLHSNAQQTLRSIYALTNNLYTTKQMLQPFWKQKQQVPSKLKQSHDKMWCFWAGTCASLPDIALVCSAWRRRRNVVIQPFSHVISMKKSKHLCVKSTVTLIPLLFLLLIFFLHGDQSLNYRSTIPSIRLAKITVQEAKNRWDFNYTFWYKQLSL